MFHNTSVFFITDFEFLWCIIIKTSVISVAVNHQKKQHIKANTGNATPNLLQIC